MRLKVDFRSKSFFLHIHLYFVATQNLWNYDLVEDIDNWTRSYILKIIFNALVLNDFEYLPAIWK